MKEHQGLPWWAWAGGAVLLVALIALVIWAIVDSSGVDASDVQDVPDAVSSQGRLVSGS